MANRFPLGNGGQSLIRSFLCAITGFLHALHYERNLRIDFAMAGFVLYFSRYYALTRGESALLIMLIGFVITCEMINTAIENTVDLETSDYHSLARIAKDVAAGAVLVAAVSCVVAGVILFWDFAVLGQIWRDVRSHLFLWLVTVTLALAWIFFPREPKNR